MVALSNSAAEMSSTGRSSAQALQDRSLDLNANLQPLFDVINGPVAWEIFHCALELKFFDALVQPTPATELAKRLTLDPGTCEHTLQALVGLGFVDLENGLYCMRPQYVGYLVSDTDRSLNEVIRYLARRSHRGLDSLRDALVSGTTRVQQAEFSIKQIEWSEACAEIAIYQKALGIHWAHTVLSKLEDFVTCRHLLDLSGGPGLCGIYLAEQRSDLQVTLFELPKTIEFAKGYVEAKGLADRVRLIAGDYNRDVIGSSYDIVWASMCFYFAEPDLEALLARLYHCVKPGGLIVSFHEGIDASSLGEPQFIRRFMPSLWNAQKLFEKREVSQALRSSGFEIEEHRQVETAIGPMMIDICRRPLD